jgi:hypothetical protein
MADTTKALMFPMSARCPMASLARRSLLVVLFAGLAFQSSPMAASPSIVLVYGGDMERAITVRVDSEDVARSTLFLYGLASDGAVSQSLAGRPYVNVAMFWGPSWAEHLKDQNRLSQLRPLDANQHGRLYLPTGIDPAVMLVTHIRGAAFGEATMQDFTSGWTIDDAGRQGARRIGIPGF